MKNIIFTKKKAEPFLYEASKKSKTGSGRYYLKDAKEVLEFFHSGEGGLSEKEAQKRMIEFGANELPETEREGLFKIFFRQFKSPLIYVLIAASAAVFFSGEIIDALAIAFVLLFNATIGTIQEGKAQNAFLALRKFIKGKAVAVRSGKEMILPDKKIVPGDLILLHEGEKVPADARVVYSDSLEINEAALTGESVPRFKSSAAIKKENLPVFSQNNMVFKGTTVVSGNARAVVTATGADTFLGEIAKETLKIDSEFPLKKTIEKLSRFVLIFVSIVSLVLVFLGIINNHPIGDILKTIVAVSVSVIPEGLPIVMTLVLASGVWRMGKKQVLVKKLQAVEVLGETRILAVDKTGTVTKNELAVEEVYAGGNIFEVKSDGYNPEGEIFLSGKKIDSLNHPELLLAGRVAALNSDVNLIYEKNKKIWKATGDPTEGALAVFSKKIGFHRDNLLSEMPLKDKIPFNYRSKFHISLHKFKKSNFMAVTGSPEIILKEASFEWDAGEPQKLSLERKKEIQSVLKSMSKKGLRVIGFSYCQTQNGKIEKDDIPHLVFGGFFGIKDELREGVKKAVREVREAGIKIVMITGDHEITARSIAEEAGIYKKGDQILNGEDLDKMSGIDLAEKINKISVFARITPEQKLKIIKAYEKNGQVVAMTGDGVNDALSLTAANIGIGMGKIGTEVAKEASDLILLDDNFGNIVAGVEEGRNIFNTMKKVILYLFSTGLGEVFTLLGALFLGFPLPVLAVQILWLNLVTDGFLDVALAMEPGEKDINRNYLKRNKIIDSLMIWRMFLMASIMGIGTLFLFSRGYANDLPKFQTISLTVLAVFQWFNAWNCRSAVKSIFQMNPFSNKFLFGATGIVISLQILAVYNPFFQKIFRTVSLNVRDWLVIIALALSIVAVEEIRKLFYRLRSKPQ